MSELFSNLDWQPFWLTAKLAGITTLILAVLGVVAALYMAHRYGVY